MIEDLISIIKQASNKILSIKNSGIKTSYKIDNSPVTNADIESNIILTEGLQKISNYPVVSEESPIPYSIRKSFSKFWLIDPLDGTKSFLKGLPSFTINIALIEYDTPILGIIMNPSTGDIYYAEKGKGAFKNYKIIYNQSKRTNLIAAKSIHHSNEETVNFLEKNNIVNLKEFGSSLKLCSLAEGLVDIYPRYNGTKEWDTAAGHIIIKESGCEILEKNTFLELKYNKREFENNHFVAFKKNIEFEF